MYTFVGRCVCGHVHGRVGGQVEIKNSTGYYSVDLTHQKTQSRPYRIQWHTSVLKDLDCYDSNSCKHLLNYTNCTECT